MSVTVPLPQSEKRELLSTHIPPLSLRQFRYCPQVPLPLRLWTNGLCKESH